MLTIYHNFKRLEWLLKIFILTIQYCFNASIDNRKNIEYYNVIPSNNFVTVFKDYLTYKSRRDNSSSLFSLNEYIPAEDVDVLQVNDRYAFDRAAINMLVLGNRSAT